MNIGSRLAKFRKAKGLSKNKLAKESGVTQGFISQVELGNRLPTLDVLSRICSALGITLAEFFADECDRLETISNDVKSLLSDIQTLSPLQAAAVKNIIAELSLINQEIKQAKSNNKHKELLDLFNTTETITIAGKPISLEERIKILEALKEIIDPGEGNAAAENEEALAASYQGDGLVYIPTPEEAEDIKKAIEFAKEQKRKEHGDEE